MPNVELSDVKILEPDTKYETNYPGLFKKLEIDYQCKFNESEVKLKYPYKVDVNLYAPLPGYAFNLGRLIANCTAVVPTPNVVATGPVVSQRYVIHIMTKRLPQLPAGLTFQEYPGYCIPDFECMPFIPEVKLTCIAPPQVIVIAPPPYMGCSGWFPRPCCCR